ncbi:19158_t:CDS:2, partial [Gigaspora rosea]
MVQYQHGTAIPISKNTFITNDITQSLDLIKPIKLTKNIEVDINNEQALTLTISDSETPPMTYKIMLAKKSIGFDQSVWTKDRLILTFNLEEKLKNLIEYKLRVQPTQE